MYMPKNDGADFTPPPAGTHLAVCYRVIDLGTQQVEFQGQRKMQHKIMLSWELPEELMEDGKPFTVHQRYTYSSNEKARLRQDLEAWRGAKFQDSDFGPGGFDIKRVIGVGCNLTILHNNKDGRTYANITAISKLRKGDKAPALINTPTYLDLSNFDQVAFDSLSEGLKAVIAKSPEYAEAMRPNMSEANPPPHSGNGREDIEEEIPF